jgi:hypothetical protein
MAISILDSEQFKNITHEAMDQIKLGSANDWINISSFIRKAYYLGMVNALTPISKEEDLKRLLVDLIRETMFSSETELDQQISKAVEDRKNGR